MAKVRVTKVKDSFIRWFISGTHFSKCYANVSFSDEASRFSAKPFVYAEDYNEGVAKIKEIVNSISLPDCLTQDSVNAIGKDLREKINAYNKEIIDSLKDNDSIDWVKFQ